jgi:hypothetical protein
MLYDAIQTTPAALAAAQAEDWPACAAALQAISVTAAARECKTRESGGAVMQAGGEIADLLSMLADDADRTGMFLFTKLSGGDGVAWADPLTIPYLTAKVASGAMTQQVMDALVQLSAPTTHPWTDVTAEDCEAAWTAETTRVALAAIRGTVQESWMTLSDWLEDNHTATRAEIVAQFEAELTTRGVV